MDTLFVNGLSLSRSSSTTPRHGASLTRSQSKQGSGAYSSRTSAFSSSPSEYNCITSSQQATPAGTPELRRRARGKGLRLRVENLGHRPITRFIPRDDDADAPNMPPRSLTDAHWPHWSTVVERSLDSPTTEESTITGTTLIANHTERKSASINALALKEALTRPNSLETEMNVDAEDQELLAKALELLSLNPRPSTLGRLGASPTLRTSTINTLGLPESTTRALYALVTNAFAPYQFPAAREIQRFMHANPDTPLPPFLITKDIAEIYGEHGWCLIGQCGLERLGYKIACLTSTSNVTDEELKKDQTWRRIEHLCGHIRDRHFEQMPFQCHLCPASYTTQYGLDRHWRTHPLGEFACLTRGDIVSSDVSLRRQQHSKHTKATITAKFRRLLARAVPLT